MANQNVAAFDRNPEPGRRLSLSVVNATTAGCHRVIGMIEIMRSAALSNDPPNAAGVACVCDLASEMLTQLLQTIADAPKEV